MSQAEIAAEFLRMCSRGEVEQAFARHVAPGFIHHNPWFPGDRASLQRAMAENAASEPDKSLEVMHVVDGGDRVALLSRLKRVAAGVEYAVVHIVRFHDGKIVELWDVAQQIPDGSANANGPF